MVSDLFFVLSSSSRNRTQKTAIAAEIVAKVKGQKPRGRFLKLVEGDKKNLFDRKNIFVEAEKERVSLKISGFMSSMRPFEEDEDDEPDLATGVSFRLRETDVVLLVGRGNGGTKVHSGNNMLRRLCWEAKDAYRIADK